MTDRLAPITGRLDRLARAFEPSTATVRTLSAATEPALRSTVDTIAATEFGSDRRTFRNEPGTTDRSTTTLTTAGSTMRVTLELRPSRAWKYAEKGAKRHRIVSDDRTVLAGGLRHPVRGTVNHPGTRGRRTITRTRDRIRQQARPLVLTGVRDVIEGTARG